MDFFFFSQVVVRVVITHAVELLVCLEAPIYGALYSSHLARQPYYPGNWTGRRALPVLHTPNPTFVLFALRSSKRPVSDF